MSQRYRSLWALALPALLLVACDDDGATDPDAGETDAGETTTDGGETTTDGGETMTDGGEAMTDGGETSSEPPLYVLHSATQPPEGRVNYFTLVPSVTDETTIDYSSSIEVSGRARLYAQPSLGFFVIGDSEDVTLTRYTLEEDGTATPGDSFSLQGAGVSTLGAQAVYFASETVAYYKDPNQAQVIIWNPTSMEIIDTIELPAELIRDDRLTSFGDWIGRDGDAFFAVTWYTEAYDRVDPGTALVHIDTTTNDVTVTEDDRCRELASTAEIDGSLYFFSGVINAFGHAVYPDDAGQENCSLRIAPGEDTFDPDYVGSVAANMPENTGATVVYATGTDLWAQFVDLEVAPHAPGTTYGEWYEQGWTWWRMPLDSDVEATQITTTSGAYSSFAVAGEDFFMLAESQPDYSSTTLLDVSAGGTPAPGITFPGFTLDVIRVR